MKRAVIILLVVLFALTMIAASCDPDPDPGGWQPTQGSPADGANATATYGAEEWHAQLTDIAETEEP